MNVLADTNVALYLLGGDEGAARLLDGQSVHVSFVTELELLGYTGASDEDVRAIRSFLSDCVVVDLTASIKTETIGLRRRSRLKLPDAIVAATAIAGRMPLISADRGFERVEGVPLLLYEP